MATGGSHILLYPYPTSGHIIPLLDLAHQLFSRGLTITILVTPTNQPLLQPLQTTHPNLHPLILPSPQTPTSITPQNRLTNTIRGLHHLHYPILLQWFQSHPSPPVAIISDFFLGWTHHLAIQLNIKRIVFSPSGAFSQSGSFSLWRDLIPITDPEDLNFPVTYREIPNSPVYPLWQISVHYRNYKKGDSDSEYFRDGMLANMASWGYMFNSFTEFEGVYIDYVKKEMGHDRVWAVGPLLPPGEDGSTKRRGTSSVSARELTQWLDSRVSNSVVYVCFGSRVVLTRQQTEVLATALEESGVNFIWCVRDGEIIDGFEERTAGKGLVIKGWAPQVGILNHDSVGVFLTHCGWNSVLEGVAAGVVMLTWPMGADQFTNAKLLVDQLGVAIRVGEGTINIPESYGLASVLSKSVAGGGGGGGLPERDRVRKLSEAAKGAVKGGTSEKDLDEFVKRLIELHKSS